jgi:uncharacterized membrane protein
MPYNWTHAPAGGTAELHIWPHQSLRPRGYVRFIGITAALIAVPLLPLLGSVLLWGLLPFLAAAVFGLKWALDRNRRSRQVLEVLRLGPEQAELERQAPDEDPARWSCNRHWASVQIYPHQGPVPNYVTLRGNGREVEIGAFLSEAERKALYDSLCQSLRAA